MDGSFVKEMNKSLQPVFKELEGLTYSNKEFEPILPPAPSRLVVHSLTAIVDYCNHELKEGKNYIVHVESPYRVNVYSRLSEDGRERENYLQAQLAGEIFNFDAYHDVENFVISLQSMFVQTDVTAKILSVVGNMTSETKLQTHDDGVTQDVTVKKGIQKEGWETIENPVNLAPYRTFTEVKQPSSNFVLRIKPDSHRCALFEADGGAWKNEAIQNIAGLLSDELKAQLEAKQITILA